MKGKESIPSQIVFRIIYLQSSPLVVGLLSHLVVKLYSSVKEYKDHFLNLIKWRLVGIFLPFLNEFQFHALLNSVLGTHG